MSGPGDPEESDVRLGRLLAEGLGRQAGHPVDPGELLEGARRGAVRIRRRRRTVLGLATAVVIVVPGGAAVSQLVAARQLAVGSAAAGPASAGSGPAELSAPGDSARQLAEDAGSGDPAAAAAGVASSPAVAGGSLPVTQVPSPPQPAASRSAARQVVVPDAALLGPADLPQATLRRTSDTADGGPVGAAPGPAPCGEPLTGLPAAAGTREVVLEQGSASAASSWLLGSTVRVFAADGAGRYLAAVGALACITPVEPPTGDQAVVGQGRPDAQGRAPWYGAVRVGRVVAEVRLVVPRGADVTRADVARLAGVAGQRVAASGLVAAAASDPGLA